MNLINKINLQDKFNAIPEMFSYLKLGQLNDHMLNIVQGENRTLEFHKHNDSDEMFFIIEGKMQIEFENEVVNLSQGEFMIVPRGKLHRPICKDFVKVLIIEKEGTLTKENTGGTYTS